MAVVLVVDDERAIAEMVAELVDDHGHDVFQASHGAEALALARAHRPSLIISDVMMPVMHGYALLQAIRMEPDLANTQVYLMSAATVDYLGRNLAIRPDGFLPKPLDFGLLDAVLQALSRE